MKFRSISLPKILKLTFTLTPVIVHVFLSVPVVRDMPLSPIRPTISCHSRKSYQLAWPLVSHSQHDGHTDGFADVSTPLIPNRILWTLPPCSTSDGNPLRDCLLVVAPSQSAHYQLKCCQLRIFVCFVLI